MGHANGTLRLATPGERERLIHFPDNYTIAAVPNSMYKIAPHSAFVTRVSLWENTLDYLLSEWLLGRLAGAAGYLSAPPTFEELIKGDVESCTHSSLSWSLRATRANL